MGLTSPGLQATVSMLSEIDSDTQVKVEIDRNPQRYGRRKEAQSSIVAAYVECVGDYGNIGDDIAIWVSMTPLGSPVVPEV